MQSDITWAIGGEAGFGIMSSGTILAKAFSRDGYSVIATNEYPSLIRGGHNFVSVRISTNRVFAPKNSIDFFVALNKETVSLHKEHLAKGAILLFDPKDYEWKKEEVPDGVVLFSIPLSELGGQRNTIAIGASLALLGKDFSLLSSVIRDQFTAKGDSVISENVQNAKKGYEYVTASVGTDGSCGISEAEGKEKQLVINASEAFGLGAIRGGMKFAAIYPMTPINALIPLFADNAKDLGIIYKQPEDEIAGINMAIGAALTGARSMVATSGGGFALMEEAVSMAGIMEVPIVVNLGMRPGPATGMPTWTEQGELQMVVHAGHGDFPRVVLAPGDVEDAYKSGLEAFDLAEKYQTPVFVLTDKYLNETQWQLPVSFVGHECRMKVDSVYAAIDESALFKRYDVKSESGVSKRSLLGTKNGAYIANSYEHDEEGFTTEEAEMRTKMVDKRAKKMELIRNDAYEPEVFGEKHADITFVCFGSLKGVVRQVVEELIQQAVRVKCIFFRWVYPLPKSTETILKAEKQLICIEQNSVGQFASLIREQTGIDIKTKWLKYNGRQWAVEEILWKTNSLLR